MKFDFSDCKITLVVAPIDMRAGFNRLALLANAFLSIDVQQGQDVVIFLSKRRKIAKIIWADSKGTSVVTRRLHVGCFEPEFADLFYAYGVLDSGRFIGESSHLVGLGSNQASFYLRA